MYQGIISNTQHNITAGLTMMYDQYNENVEGTPWQRKDIVPGGFAEYTWKYLEKITLVAGMRIDKPNRFNWQFNPRLHFRYTPVEGTVIRLAGGRGFRIPNIFAENPFVFASSRTWMIHEKPQYEAAWNSGISFMQSFKIAEKKSSVQVDFFRTQFVKNVIVDIENSDNTAMVYNIGKGSYANSFLVEWNIEPIARFDIKIAYKWEDVKMQQKEGLIRKSMISPHRGLLVLSYKTKNEQWMFNTQWSLHGRHRLPNSFQGNTQQYSPVYALGGIQVTRYQKKFEFFLGAENLLNTRQRNPIIGAENPFGDKFDTYQVWGPVIGTIAYGGIRATI
jgi:outer membrane receptor for ferrienterochelin and colicin